MKGSFFEKIPNSYFIVSGTGIGKTELNSFDFALLDAGLGNLNLVRMSSILPPYANRIAPYQLPFGSLVPVAYGFRTLNVTGSLVSAAIAIAFPKNKRFPGLIMEYDSVGESSKSAEKTAEEMAVDGIIGRGLELDHTEAISSEIISHNKYATAFAAIVLCYNTL